MGIDDFDLEPSSAEPEEWDPEDDLYDPTADGLTIPQVSTDEADVDAEIAQTFWIVVLIVNGAVLFVSVGPMLWFFWGWTRKGVALILGGLLLFGLAYRRYRRFMRNTSADHGSSKTDNGGERTTAEASSDVSHSSSETGDDPESAPTNTNGTYTETDPHDESSSTDTDSP